MRQRKPAAALIAALMLTLAACSMAPQKKAGTEAAPASLAVRELVGKAESASAAGRHDQASAYLERAIHIAPRNAVLWQNLAVVRYRQRRFEQAESLAMKSNALSAEPALKRRNWALIAAARQARGDDEGAQAAQDHVKQLQQETGD